MSFNDIAKYVMLFQLSNHTTIYNILSKIIWIISSSTYTHAQNRFKRYAKAFFDLLAQLYLCKKYSQQINGLSTMMCSECDPVV